MDKQNLSKFISLILRHNPGVINKELDNDGYMLVEDLLEGLNKNNNVDFQLLEEIVAEDKKQRYSFNNDKTKIRANQGHSIKVNLNLKETIPPIILYHGTGLKYKDSILKYGLLKKSRQFVHLSSNLDTAIDVGERHGKPIVFTIDTQKMIKDGFKFYISENNVWLIDSVPSKYLKILKDY